VSVENTTVAGNAFGLVSTGNKAVMLVGSTTVTGNGTGLLTSVGGAMFSYGNNRVNGNSVTDGAFSGTIAQK
jgi:hypothetical protein